MAKITDEQLDDMDCRPLGRETGVGVSEEVMERVKAGEAARSRAARVSACGKSVDMRATGSVNRPEPADNSADSRNQ